jgi:N-acetylmuramoyl-L-alanine amidase
MKIMLDAGHGYSTPGKRSPDGMKEYEFNKRVTDVMKEALEKYEDVTVYFAHDDSRDVPLKERTDLANKLAVDLFVSIHANANTGKMGDWGGIDTFVYTTKPKDAVALANVIQRNLISATGLRNRGVKPADFHVLRETNMTAVLIEHGFMDSTTDLPLLKSDVYRKLCGETNAKSIADVYGLKRKLEAPVIEVASVQKSEYVGRKLIVKADGLPFYDEPRWDKSTGKSGAGHAFIITEELTVNGARMLRCHDGKYRTADPAHVSVTPKPSDWPYSVSIDGVTHAEAAEIVAYIGAKYKNAKAEGKAK